MFRKWPGGSKDGQKTETEISPKKASRWPTGTWKYVQHCSLLEQTQMETTVRHHFTLVSMAISKRSANSKCLREGGERGLCYTVGGNAN